jgi:hypothetical protein
MKNLLFFALILVFATSCINSEYTATDASAYIDDDAILGVWKGITKEKSEKEEARLILKKGNSKGEYVLEMETIKDNDKSNPEITKLMAYISKIGKNKIVSFGGKDLESGKNQFFYGKYTIKGDLLSVQIFVETSVSDANKAGKNVKSNMKSPAFSTTVFANAKKIQAFIKKNVNNPDYFSEEGGITFKKENN